MEGRVGGDAGDGGADNDRISGFDVADCEARHFQSTTHRQIIPQ